MFYPKALAVAALIWTVAVGILVVASYSRTEPRFKFTSDSRISPNGGDGTAKDLELRAIGEAAAYNLKHEGIKGPVPKQDLAKIIEKSDPKFLFPLGVTFRTDEDGNLIDTRDNSKYQVYSDGNQVIVKASFASEPQYFPY